MENQANKVPTHNLGLDLLRATEAAALAAGRWIGMGKPLQADADATDRMYATLNLVTMDAQIVVSEEMRIETCNGLEAGQCVGAGEGPQVDLVVDPIDGRELVAGGLPGAIAVMAVAPAEALWRPRPAAYMDKVVVDAEVADALVPEVLDAPAAWTLALVARAKGKDVEDLTVFVLDRPRHANLVAEIRDAGAHVMLHREGDVTGALLAALPEKNVDLLMGVGGIPEGLIAACAVKVMGGAMVGRLKPQSDAEFAGIVSAGIDVERILVTEEILSSEEVFFAATGITDGPLLSGVRYRGQRAESNSLVMRGQTRTRRIIQAWHVLEEQTEKWSRYIPGEPFG